MFHAKKIEGEMAKPDKQEGVSEAIRAEIAKIPASELPFAKPSRVLPGLEAAGFEITAAVRSTTSKLLVKAKKGQGKTGQGEIVSVAQGVAEGRAAEDRKELAMRLVEACCGDFDMARAEIARLEQFFQKVKRA